MSSLSATELQNGRAPSAPSLGSEDVSPSQWRLVWRGFRKHRLGMIGLGTLAVILFAITFVPIFFPDPYGRINPDNNTWTAPIGTVDPSNGHVFWLGSDKYGRDNFTLLFQAGRLSLIVGVVPALIVLAVGFVVGAVAGYYGGWIDGLLMRVCDFLIALPLMPAYIIAIRLIRPQARTAEEQTWGNVTVLITVFVLFGWMGVSRLVRGLVLSLRTQPFVEAARALGASTMRIIVRHLLPSTIGPLLTAGLFLVGDFIILEAVLAYFGLGIVDPLHPPVVSWGNILANNSDQAWFLTNLNPFQQIRGYLVIFPTIMLLVTVLSINFIGDAIRDVLDPRRHS